jgi:GntR family transcriptional repressor for pyruvate dehydrogenase complex
MESLKKERVSILVFQAINKIINSEQFKPGDKFYSESQLSKRLEVSRSSIREAVRMLEVSGLVSVHQGKGVFINELSDDDYPMKSWAVDNIELLREHFEVRLLIEPHAASVAAERASIRDIEKLEAVYRDFCLFVSTESVTEAIARDGEFHHSIARITHNRTLSILMKTMAQTLNEGWFASLNIPGRLERSAVEHGKVLEDIKAGDGKSASKDMMVHLTNALEDIKKYTGKF